MTDHLKAAGFNLQQHTTSTTPQDTIPVPNGNGRKTDVYDTDPNSNLIPSPATPPLPDYVSPWPGPL